MLIKYPMLAARYWVVGKGNSNSGVDQVPDVFKCNLGYELEEGQNLHSITYYGSFAGNRDLMYHVKIEKISEEGVTVSSLYKGGFKVSPYGVEPKVYVDTLLFPWEKEFTLDAKKEVHTLQLEPIGYLKQKPTVPLFELDPEYTDWREWSDCKKFGQNLKNFVKLGQQTI
jgi:hypothetical protein